MLLVFLPIFILLKLIIKKDELTSMEFSKAKIKKGNIFLIAYIVLIMAVLILLIIFIPRQHPTS
jgi:hypothetical protein